VLAAAAQLYMYMYMCRKGWRGTSVTAMITVCNVHFGSDTTNWHRGFSTTGGVLRTINRPALRDLDKCPCHEWLKVAYPAYIHVDVW
jgi:hypothetical protein